MPTITEKALYWQTAADDARRENIRLTALLAEAEADADRLAEVARLGLDEMSGRFSGSWRSTANAITTALQQHDALRGESK